MLQNKFKKFMESVPIGKLLMGTFPVTNFLGIPEIKPKFYSRYTVPSIEILLNTCH